MEIDNATFSKRSLGRKLLAVIIAIPFFCGAADQGTGHSLVVLGYPPIIFYIVPIAIIPWLLLTVYALFEFPDHRRLFLYSAPLAIFTPLLMFLFIWACARNHSCP